MAKVQPVEMAKPPKKMPVEVSFDETDLPEIKSWKVGGKYAVNLQIEMTSIGKDAMDNEKELRARFKVLEVSAKPESKSLQDNLPKNFKGNPNKL